MSQSDGKSRDMIFSSSCIGDDEEFVLLAKACMTSGLGGIASLPLHLFIHECILDIHGYLFIDLLPSQPLFSWSSRILKVLEGLLMEMKLELVAIPVTDVDRARDFYKDKVGFNLDHDHTVSEKLRFVQMTPVGSACSICFGIGIADNMKPGSIKGLQMVVKDAQAAHDELRKRGVDVSDVDTQVWGKFVRFNDPDGNAWAIQELPPRS